jgi:uncharacterized beta-barrel protein YwiB (DUF1934 family)
MDKNVIIYLKGLQFAQTEDGTEPIQVIAPGQYYFKNGSHYLLYEDADDGGEGGAKNTIKFKPDHLEVIKNGSISTKLVFEKDKKTLSQYQTPFGIIMIGVTTTSIELSEEENSIGLKAKYSMDINGTFLADCEVNIKAQAKTSDFSLTN